MKSLMRLAGVLAIALVQTCDAQGNDFAVLHTFNPAAGDGIKPLGGVIVDMAGNIYGTTYLGGQGDNGTVFRLKPSGKFTTIYYFSAGNDGRYSMSLLLGRHRPKLFGTTANGGVNTDGGIVFRLTKRGSETVLHSFVNDSGGYAPQAGVIADLAGNLYGTNYSGGANFKGTVYKLAPDGSVTVLHAFSGNDGANPDSELIMDKAGNLYGTTPLGGAQNFGVVFKISAAGVYSVLHDFTGPAPLGGDGSYPSGGLTLDAAGNLYGTTLYGGLYDDYGTVFKVTPQGNETVLHIFYGPLAPGDGANPYAPLVIDHASNLYGTTRAGGMIAGCSIGSPGCGMIFKLAPDGTMTSLHAFNGSDGYAPVGALAPDKLGNFYGATSAGGAFGDGVVFRVKR